MYLESEETIIAGADRSYGGYNDFIKYLNSIRKLKYVLPSVDTPPENGMLYDKKLINYLLEDLNHIKSKNFDILNNEKWFFEEFHKMVLNASKLGLIVIC